jgi:radical SAM/Cys-rich protein
MVRTNLAIYSEPGMDDIPEFLAEKGVRIIASLPCYTEENVDKQRGKGTYTKAIEAIKRLNSLGYGKDGTGLELDIMFNPMKEDIAPDQKMLEKAYKEKLYEMHGITFNRLMTLNNMPIGRLGKSLSEAEYNKYIETLKSKFNPDTVDGLMCRYLISVSPWGNLHDCDFWQALRLPVTSQYRTIYKFDYNALKEREIVTNVLCFMCTAGAGASCTGAIT